MTSQIRANMTKLLSDVFDSDRRANNPRTQEFLEAGERLLWNGFARDATSSAAGQQQPPFEEVLAWLSRRRVVAEAIRGWQSGGDGGKGQGSGPTEAAFRYRWRTQTAYLRDVAIWALLPRTQRSELTERACLVIERARTGACQLHEAIRQIAHGEISTFTGDPAFRMQMIFRATLADDPHVSDALHQTDEHNVNAWTEFARRSYRSLGLTLRKDLEFTQLGRALHAAGQGTLFHSILASHTTDDPSSSTELMALLVKALVIATADHGDGRTLDDVLHHLFKPHAQAPPAEP